MRPEIRAAIKILQAQCHTIVPQEQDGVLCFEIDGHLLASWEEVQHLIDGVYTIRELEALHSLRAEYIAA